MQDVKRLLQRAAELTRGFVNYPDPDYGRDADDLDRLAALLPDAAELAAMAEACERLAPGLGRSDFDNWSDYATTLGRLRATARLLWALSGETHKEA